MLRNAILVATVFFSFHATVHAADASLFEGSVVPFDEFGVEPYGSAALVRFSDSKAGDAAYILTVGHVNQGGQNPGTEGFVSCVRSTREFSLMNRYGKPAATVVAEKLLYATRSANLVSDKYASDFALYRLRS